ncbi:hypothetical protein Cfor_07473 [Coptotermes formosanus]|uniref:Chitin-binding type-2 domain-containing protein n=1 Tax=Coptotermes formosanus TaxID=36987 RepID=A0A6L2PE71_COPFO|nr:hypothetical protein Cfor_07473 [Coptotermes formosanus]
MAEDLDGSDVWRTAAGGCLAEVKRWANGLQSFSEKRPAQYANQNIDAFKLQDKITSVEPVDNKMAVWVRMVARQAPSPEEALGLPSNATSIRSDITDTFSCESRIYGYYADVDNDCQLFHVCLPVQFANGKEQTFKWSFICPEETVFNQESFTCTRPEDAIACEEAPQYYSLNEGFGQTDRPFEPSPAPSAAETTQPQ